MVIQLEVNLQIFSFKTMNQIKCPKCNEIFKIDETGYSDILKQVRDKEFQNELDERLELADEDKIKSIQLARKDMRLEMQDSSLNKDIEIQDLQSQLKLADASKALVLAEAEKKCDILLNKIEQIDENNKTSMELAITKAVGEVKKERDLLRSNLRTAEVEYQLSERLLKDKYESQIKDRENEIIRIMDMKSKLSTKMLGESLEKHCETEFNRYRATAFPKAYFEKDNDVTTGSKGDYIFREMNDSDNEIVSIMFEMKNEGDTTSTKKKNVDFLKELDKDRLEKCCEYAVLVSLLETDSDYYNSGIVDVSHCYPKMYIVRPQCFLPIITLLRNAAMNSLEYKTELALVKAQNIDITNFENDLVVFKNSFGLNRDRCHKKFDEAIKGIDNAMKDLQKTKDALVGADNNLRLANEKLQDVSVKRLTRSNPTMAKKFDDLKK